MRESDVIEMRRLSIVGLLALVAMGIVMSLAGCSPVRYVPIESVKYDSVYINKIQYDSIYHRDSIYVEKNGDTTTIYKDRYLYKYLFRTDTVQVTRVDSVQVPYPVEKKLTRWQKIKIELGGWSMGIILSFAIIIVGWLIFRMRRK
ncbi:hypothetical protein [Bacteroides sp. UBA939]|uniref:hypothetical protein n=1 Tax=Bacteroides sp. UBA939 TaxID=1946092 RepID=UPI0025C667DD|nr:hypothetical protein [Bacteroides sp. UBA939]